MDGSLSVGWGADDLSARAAWRFHRIKKQMKFSSGRRADCAPANGTRIGDGASFHRRASRFDPLRSRAIAWKSAGVAVSRPWNKETGCKAEFFPGFGRAFSP